MTAAKNAVLGLIWELLFSGGGNWLLVRGGRLGAIKIWYGGDSTVENSSRLKVEMSKFFVGGRGTSHISPVGKTLESAIKWSKLII